MLSRKPYDGGVKDFSAVDHMFVNLFTSARISQIFIGSDFVVYKMSAVQKIMDFFKAHGSVHHNSMLIKTQPDATVCRYLFTAKSAYMFRVSQHPSSGVLKTVTATSGTGHTVKYKD